MSGSRTSLWALALVVFVSNAAIAEDHHPIVVGFERFHGKGQDAAGGGQLLLGELNCVACHNPADANFPKKQAPILDEVGSRVRVGHLRKFLTDPHAVKPGSTMPRVLDGDPKRSEKIEALVHFLASTGTPKQERQDLKAMVIGRDTYQKVGCVACHGPRDGTGQPIKVNATIVPLGDIKSKYTIASLSAFLENPHRVRPSGRMPQMLNAKEAKDIANYLLTGIRVELSLSKGTTSFNYFEGGWDKLPDFTKVKPKLNGVGPAFDLGIAPSKNNWAIQFEGYFKVEREGVYRFTTESDDGSALWIDGKKVVDNDGVHATKGASGQTTLKKGNHKIAVGFFQEAGGADLTVSMQGPGIALQNMAAFVSATEAGLEAKAPPKKPTVSEDDIDVNPEMVKKGRALFASTGCANCHQLKESNKTIVSTLQAPKLEKLNGVGGCLSNDGNTPRFDLNVPQQVALKAAIKTSPIASKDPSSFIARTMTTFNCYACHDRGKIGGPEEALNKSFLTTQPEMGDEGRVPPPLDGAGSKLNPEYLRSILDRGGDDRPYMHAKMPGFGLANVAGLANAFIAVDTAKQAHPIKFDVTEGKVKAAGRFMVGAQSLSCIKCHTFAGQRAEGVQGMDLTLMARRLNHDWFRHYMLDPQQFRPGTRMPTSWLDGQTFYPNLLGGKAEAQIEAIWVYLKEGSGAQMPVGYGKKSIPLVPQGSAIIYRNFIQGAGTRAIGVGYPEKLNLAFDANELRIAMLWEGAFIDAGKHWTDRGSGFEGPLGDNILKLHAGPPFAVLLKNDEAWPEKSPAYRPIRFDGYKLTPDDRPTFLYSFDGVKVEDFASPIAGPSSHLKRSIKLLSNTPPARLFYRSAVGNKIEALKDGWFKVDGWKIKVQGGGAHVRQVGGKSELIVRPTFEKGCAELVLEMMW